MASDQDFKCGGGEIWRWRNCDFPKITYLLTMCTFAHFEIFKILQMFCEQFKNSGNPLIWVGGRNGENREILRNNIGCFWNFRGSMIIGWKTTTGNHTKKIFGYEMCQIRPQVRILGVAGGESSVGETAIFWTNTYGLSHIGFQVEIWDSKWWDRITSGDTGFQVVR